MRQREDSSHRTAEARAEPDSLREFSCLPELVVGPMYCGAYRSLAFVSTTAAPERSAGKVRTRSRSVARARFYVVPRCQATVKRMHEKLNV